MTRLRVGAVGLHLDPARVATRESFAASVRATLDRYEVAAEPRTPTLIAFPEHTGLLVMLAGEAGASARAVLERGGGSLEALTALAVAYGGPLGHYAARFPAVGSPGQLLHLALTDTVVHVLVDTFAGLARERRLWVSVGAALPDWREVTGDPVAKLTADRTGRRHAYEATGPQVWNRNLVFDPDGELVAVQDKAYLVPMERDAAGGLGLAAIAVDRVGTLDLPFGRLGSVISKDAWMVDVNDRLDQLGASVLIQPEAFDRWNEAARGPGADGRVVTDLWPPDKFQRGGWWMVQRQPAIRVNAAPVLLGSFGDLRFDGQPSVAVPAPAGDPRLALLGQSPDEGWAAVGPWWRDARSAEALADPDQRPRLAKAGPAPAHPEWGAGGGDILAVATVEVPPGTPTPSEVPALVPLEASRDVGASGSLLGAHLYADGDACWLVGVAGDGQARQDIVVTQLRDSGWSAPTAVAPSPPGTPTPFDRQWHPRLAGAADGRLLCVYLAFPAESWDVFAARGDEAGWAPATRLDDAHRDLGVLRERGHDAPVVVRDGADLVAAWSDLRWPWVMPQVRWARSRDDGRTWSASRRLDGGPTAGSADHLAPPSAAETRGQTAPALARAASGLLGAWQERVPVIGPRTWVVRADGDGWTAPVRPPGDAEGPRWRPVLAANGRQGWLVEEVASADGGVRLDVRTSADAGRTWGVSTPIDEGRPGGVVQRRAVTVPLGDVAVVVFEDDRSGTAGVLATVVGAGGPGGRVWRVDDAPAGVHARTPTAVRWGERLVVAWQDTRADHERVRSRELPLPSPVADSCRWRSA